MNLASNKKNPCICSTILFSLFSFFTPRTESPLFQGGNLNSQKICLAFFEAFTSLHLGVTYERSVFLRHSSFPPLFGACHFKKQCCMGAAAIIFFHFLCMKLFFSRKKRFTSLNRNAPSHFSKQNICGLCSG